MSNIVYPSFWEGGCWDSERLIKDVFTNPANAAANGFSGVQVVPWFPKQDDREAWVQAGNGYLRVHRRGGQLDTDSQQWVDKSMLEVAALTESRDESLDLIEYVRQMLYAYKEGGTVHRTTPHLSGVSTTFMKVPGEVVGPQLIPEQIRDERLIPVLFEVHSDMPRGLPDYRESLGLDQ